MTTIQRTLTTLLAYEYKGEVYETEDDLRSKLEREFAGTLSRWIGQPNESRILAELIINEPGTRAELVALIEVLQTCLELNSSC